MAFHNVRLTDDVERGAQGGQRFHGFIDMASAVQFSAGVGGNGRGWVQLSGQDVESYP